DTTPDTLASRGGLSLFVRYLRGVGLTPHLERLFGALRRNRKGQPVSEIFKQLFCFFLDGTSRHLVYFDALKWDEGYAAPIESNPAAMLSSHAVKRFFGSFWWPRIWMFRRLLQRLFLWRLSLCRPPVVVLNVDTMVMDNDEAEARHGVAPTYKRVKGFQPLQVTWERFIIDAVFRGGDKHGNHGDTVLETVRHLVGRIRRSYRKDVPIVLRMDSAFLDQDLFEDWEEMGIGYVVGGKLYEDVQACVSRMGASAWGVYRNKKQVWDFVEFGDRRGTWSMFRRAIFCRPRYEDEQRLLAFARPDTLLYTNLGMGQEIDQALREAGEERMLRTEEIIGGYHQRGSDELVHRALKEFASETLPFKRFAPNAAFYYTILISFFLYETFKEDVCKGVVPLTAYATTLRRKVIDFAAKIVRHSEKITLKVTTALWKAVDLPTLWKRSNTPPVFLWT
ncbi:MAG: IS1380 family transposase, partial [Thermodesulfobacteriota bacterium]